MNSIPDNLPVHSRLDPDVKTSDLVEGVKEGFDLRQVIAIVRTYMWQIIAIMVGAVVLGIVTTMLQTPQYTAGASVQIEDTAAQILQSGQDLQQESSGSWDVDRFLNTQLDVLRSRALAKRVSDRLKLVGNGRFLNAVGAGEATSGDRKRAEDRVISLLRSSMNVTLPRQSRIATISVTTADRDISASIANAYATEFIQANLQRKFESSDYARQFLAQQLSEAKSRLENSERALNAYARSAGLIRTRSAADSGEEGQAVSGSSITAASLLQVNTAANQAKATRIVAEGKWRALSSGSPLNSRDVLTNSTVQSLLTRKAEVEAELRDERTRHLDEHPAVERLRAKLASVEQELAAVVAGVRNSVRDEYLAALASEQELGRQVALLKGDTMSEQDRSVRYTILAREADTSRALYDGLLQRYKELNAAAGIASSNIALIDKAEPPMGPSAPKPLLNLAYAVMAGLLISAILVFVRLQLDDAVRVPEDVELKLQLPVLGIIPKLGMETPRQMLDEPKSSLSEAYNSLRGAIGFSTANGAPRTLLVTSASAGEGKSTTSYALARGFAKLGGKVLLVDVDMRRPSTHRQFEVENSFGLSSVLTGHMPMEGAIRQSPFENLSYMTSGPIPPSPTELLASGRMLELIEAVRGRYDMVVFDSPPILGLADAPLLSSLTDGILLVVESDRNRRGVLKGTLRRMKLAKGHVIGVALTKFDATHASSYTYYYGYGYDYYAYDGAGDRGRKKRGLFGRYRPGRTTQPSAAEV